MVSEGFDDFLESVCKLVEPSGGFSLYDQATNNRACSLDETRHVLQNRTVQWVSDPSNNFCARSSDETQCNHGME